MPQADTGFSSPYFHIAQLADGVYAALVREGSGALGNAGIVDLGYETLVFDTLLTPQAARDLRAAAEQLTGHRVCYVVNSHWHRDHVHGNQAFAGSEIIASAGTRTLLSTRGAKLIDSAPMQMPEVIRELEAALEHAQDEQRCKQLRRQLEDELVFQAALPELVLTLPTLTFDHQLTLHGARRTAMLVCCGGAHTESDTYLLLPEEGIAFVGDLVMVRNHPWLGHGAPEAWLKVLDDLERLNLKQLVSGHGPVGTKADIELSRQYIREVLALVQRLVDSGATLEQTEATAIPQQWAEWGLPEVFGWNMRALYMSAQGR